MTKLKECGSGILPLESRLRTYAEAGGSRLHFLTVSFELRTSSFELHECFGSAAFSSRSQGERYGRVKSLAASGSPRISSRSQS